MDAYQRLVDDLPPRRPEGRTRRVSEKVVRAAVAGVPLANPAQALPELERLLDGMLAGTWSGGERIAALAHLQRPVTSLAQGIERQLGIEAHPLPAASAERAATAQRLEWKLACNYAAGVHELCAPAGKPPMFKGKLAASAIVAGLQHAGRALVWAYRQYQSPPSGVWRQIHALYLFAVEAGLASQASGGAAGSDGVVSARAAYAQALLLAMSNPYGFSMRELRQAEAVIACVADQCMLVRGGAGDASVATGADAGPGYLPEDREQEGADLLMIDVQPAARAFDERMAAAPDAGGHVDLPRPGGGAVTVDTTFLRRLRDSWLNPARGHRRLPATHALDLVVGMHALHYALAGDLDFATFIRQVHGEAITVGQHELTSAWLASSDSARPPVLRGEVLDQGEGGYRLRLQADDGARLRIGEVVGLAPVADAADERGWMVGVIRWLRSEAERVVLGVELLHHTARAAGVRPVTTTGEMLVPQRAVELPGLAGDAALALLVSHPLARNLTHVEVVLPALASDWRAGAVAGIWHCVDTRTLAAACVRVTLVRDGSSGADVAEGSA